MEVLISWRIAAISFTSPLAFACNIMLPIAVPSLGPAITGTPTALQVNWFNKLFREPPPIMCSFSMGERGHLLQIAEYLFVAQGKTIENTTSDFAITLWYRLVGFLQ